MNHYSSSTKYERKKSIYENKIYINCNWDTYRTTTSNVIGLENTFTVGFNKIFVKVAIKFFDLTWSLFEP